MAGALGDGFAGLWWMKSHCPHYSLGDGVPWLHCPHYSLGVGVAMVTLSPLFPGGWGAMVTLSPPFPGGWGCHGYIVPTIPWGNGYIVPTIPWGLGCYGYMVPTIPWGLGLPWLQMTGASEVIIEPPHDKTNNVPVRPAKTQISLGAFWVAKDPSFLQADSEDSDQTGRMPRLIWVIAAMAHMSFCWFCHAVFVSVSLTSLIGVLLWPLWNWIQPAKIMKQINKLFWNTSMEHHYNIFRLKSKKNFFVIVTQVIEAMVDAQSYKVGFGLKLDILVSWPSDSLLYS